MVLNNNTHELNNNQMGGLRFTNPFSINIDTVQSIIGNVSHSKTSQPKDSPSKTSQSKTSLSKTSQPKDSQSMEEKQQDYYIEMILKVIKDKNLSHFEFFKNQCLNFITMQNSNNTYFIFKKYYILVL